MRIAAAAVGVAAAFLAGSAANAATAPTRYTVTETSNLIGHQVVTYGRDGDHAVSVQTGAPAAGFPNGLHTKAFYDLTSGTSWTLDLADPTTPCGPSHFTGDWGDPFTMSAGLTAQLAAAHPTDIGPATINGIATEASVAAVSDGSKAELWVEPNTGLIVKWIATPPKGPPSTVIEVTSLSLTPPPPSAFVLPPKCKG